MQKDTKFEVAEAIAKLIREKKYTYKYFRTTPFNVLWRSMFPNASSSIVAGALSEIALKERYKDIRDGYED